MSLNLNLQLNAVVVNLIATQDGRVPLTQGALAHAAFLDLVRAADPELADRLHESGGRQPFTISPLRELPERGSDADGHRLRVGDRAALRLTLLDPALFMAFLQRLLADGPHLRLRLGDVTFAVEDAIGAPGSHPWVGYTTTGELADRAARERHIRMVFASPTSVSWGKQGTAERRMIVIPWPQAFFASLRGAWNRLTGDTIPIAFEQWVEAYVVVREVARWQTAVYQLKRGTYPGGYGDVTFEALDAHPEYLPILNMLADFAFYSGVGTKTTMGMGQARRL